MLHCYKVRLVTFVYKEEYGIDYAETFTPIAKMATNFVRNALFVVAPQSWPPFQMDIKNAFLHEDFKEEICLPVGLPTIYKSAICRLQSSHFGLKQTPRAWFDRFRRTLVTTYFR